MIRITCDRGTRGHRTDGRRRAPCPGNPDALGTERVLAVDASTRRGSAARVSPIRLPLAAQRNWC